MPSNQVLLTGSSGLIGTSLVRSLAAERISNLSLVRTISRAGDQTSAQQVWDPYSATPVRDPRTLDGTTAAVHLSGVNIAGRRWTPAYKREILESRVKPTHALATLLANLGSKPEVLVCASAIGIYGSRGDDWLSEASAPGSGFLPEVCLAWEQATKPASDAGIRVVHLRFGVVLSPDGGALAKMLPVFRAGVGGQLGNGGQWMSWIALPDVVAAIRFALETQRLAGSVNVVTPNPVTNKKFTRTLGRVLHRPTLFAVPAFALKLAFGEMGEATILVSERVRPDELTAQGFDFKYPALEGALQAVLASGS